VPFDSFHLSDTAGAVQTFVTGQANVDASEAQRETEKSAAEASSIRDVATVWHQWRIGGITAEARDAQIATKRAAYESALRTLRNQFRVDQANDAATFRNGVAGAAKDHVTAVCLAL
jgi:hypothetical protein